MWITEYLSGIFSGTQFVATLIELPVLISTAKSIKYFCIGVGLREMEAATLVSAVMIGEAISRVIHALVSDRMTSLQRFKVTVNVVDSSRSCVLVASFLYFYHCFSFSGSSNFYNGNCFCDYSLPQKLLRNIIWLCLNRYNRRRDWWDFEYFYCWFIWKKYIHTSLFLL